MTRRQVRSAIIGLVLGTGVALTSVALGTALLLGLAVAGTVVVVGRATADVEPEVGHERRVRRDGVRGEVQDLAWSLVGRDGRVGERALRRLRDAGVTRMARHGVALADPADAPRARELLGDRAYVTLTRMSHPLPSVADARHTIGALERLGSNSPETP
ncbi:hypothetical protein [Cellulomonas sp. PhB150]|uniref:hypothetical protein n=1 Tax=Cellulomonas sp. PhB150 TaxID=2485188 RepID=UPI000F49BC74|nr:hypothetical protein [Cellulomonas sp. PhB150]ROS23876.1 hypothetical protein EDF34_2938 [Cellulomonas sp. PhB150]